MILRRLLYASIGVALTQSAVYAEEVSKASEEAQIEQIRVTGTFIKRTDQSAQSSPIQVLDASNLREFGVMVPSDVVATLTSNAGAQNQTDSFNQTFSKGTTNVNLRGLGVSSTLTLLNGRRQTLSAATTLSGDQFVDLNTLVPTIAINNIEILEDGASSLYGSDAVAGVVNFNTYKQYDGVKVSVDYINTADSDHDDLQFSVLAGTDLGDDINIVGALSYFKRSMMPASDRNDKLSKRTALSTFGNPGTYLLFPPAGPPVRTVDPACESQAAIDNDVVLDYNDRGEPTCRFDFGSFSTLMAEEKRVQAYGSAEAQLNDSTQLWVELGYATTDTVTVSSPTQPILYPPAIPSNNPAVDILGVPEGGFAVALIRPIGATGTPTPNPQDYQTSRLAAGVRGNLENDWNWEAAITYSENDFEYSNAADIKVDRFLDALAGNGGPNNDLFFNPLFGADNDPSVVADFRADYSWEAKASLVTLDAHISGDLFELPAGDVLFALGAQYREDDLEYDYSKDANDDNLYFFIGNSDFSGSRDVKAVFMELDIPVAEDLSLSVALRHENFGDLDTTDPKIGFLWTPNDNITLRGTWGTSFKVPSIFQQAGQFRVPAVIVNPATGRAGTVANLTLADPEMPLLPQESEAFNFGFSWNDWDNRKLGLSINLDYWQFEYSDFITPENAAALVNQNAVNGDFADQITKDAASGELLSVTTFYRNAGTLNTDGIDLSITQNWALSGEQSLSTSLEVTRVLTYDLTDPIIGDVDGVGKRNFTNFGVPVPELRANLGLIWRNGDDHTANVFVRYIDNYKDDNSGGAQIDSFTSVDVQYSYLMPKIGELDSGPVISVGAKNLFDKLPPDVNSRTGFDALTHNVFGRQLYLQMTQEF
jgi:iron complex outermembrane receptor protein